MLRAGNEARLARFRSAVFCSFSVLLRSASAQADWGPFPAGTLGILRSDDSEHGSPFTVIGTGKTYFNHGEPTEYGNIWSIPNFIRATPDEGMVFELAKGGQLTIPSQAVPDGSTVGLHINCGSWKEADGPGAKAIGLCSLGDWEAEGDNRWSLNDDATLSPVVHGVPIRSYVLAWGTFRWAPCHSFDTYETIVLELRHNATAPKLHFVPIVQQAGGAAGIGEALPEVDRVARDVGDLVQIRTGGGGDDLEAQPSDTPPLLAATRQLEEWHEAWRLRCCSIGEGEHPYAAAPWADFNAAMRENSAAYFMAKAPYQPT